MKLFGNKKNAAHYEKKRGWGRKQEEVHEAPLTYEDETVREVEAALCRETASVRDVPPPRRKKRGRGARKVLVALLAVLLATAGVVYALMHAYVVPPVLPTWGGPGDRPGVNFDPDDLVLPGAGSDAEQRPFTVLIAGQNNVGTLGLSNTLMLATIDIANGRIDVVSIARDTLVDLPWQVPKINGVFALTNSMDRLMEEVSRITGFPPDFYVRVNLQAFQELVDTLGGVHFNVPMRMIYDDPYDTPPLHIDLWPGYQTLTGHQAMQLVRFRQDNFGHGPTDIGRMENQQAFLQAVAREVLQVRNVVQIPSWVRIFSEHVSTDIPLGSLLWIANQLSGMDTENINFHTMPVEVDIWIHGGNYVILGDLDEWLLMVNNYLNPFSIPVTQDNVRVYTRVAGGGIQLVGGDRFLFDDLEIALGSIAG